jgi:hypothetical protein
MFPLFDLAVMLVYLGWPGLIIGLGSGAVATKNHRIIGAVVLGLVGLIVWAAIHIVLW